MTATTMMRALALLALCAAGAAEAQRRTPRGPDIVVEAPNKAAPIGGELFPVDAPPPNSCLVNAPALAATKPAAGVIDGSRMNLKALEKLRRSRQGVLLVSGVNLPGQRFDAKKRLSDICFMGAKLGLSDWSGFSGSGIGFVDSDLTGAKFVAAQLPWVLFRNAKLTGVDATGVALTRGRLDGGWSGSMRGLKLDKASLFGFRIECGVTETDGCPLERDGLSLKEANLAKASVWPFPFTDVDATGAILDQTEVGVDHLARLQGARLLGSLVVRSRRSAAIYLPAEIARIQQAFASGDQAADCGAIVTPVQRSICATQNSELRRLDKLVAQAEAGARTRVPARGVRASWLTQRDACGERGEEEIARCLVPVYRARYEALARAGGRPAWMRPGGIAMFLSGDSALSPDLARSELFMRTSPVLLESAQARVLLKVGADGRIEARGAAAGGCQLQAEGLSYDSAKLMLVGGGRPRTKRRPAVQGTAVMQLTGDELRLITTGEPYVSCGSNGIFVPMTRANVPEASLAVMWEEM
ncbi:Uncharacterized protein YjbI, contains pentapeptide repeats [Sphingomonas guangdongensis]|uniref:Uncharacterized protein YjbI, contains pentapeptide repeats n=1 Tax=Sphingomonas guangdongensis TaxID=1141890 RepID=A0A285QWV2_9SPHN|nr:pentapeptide repeat-containing protein [Sphingomonas guangdongensis]SOB86455.1 Uncharacterized protein YjbI, contains pentapeptide repeats [Sphingomonas guangdongensis]